MTAAVLWAQAARTGRKQLLPSLLQAGPYRQTKSRQLYQSAGATPTRDATAPRLRRCAGAQRRCKQQPGWRAAGSPPCPPPPGISLLSAVICSQLRTGILRERTATWIQAGFLYPSLLPLPVIDKMLQLIASAPYHRLPSAPRAQASCQRQLQKKKKPLKDNSSSRQVLSTSPRKRFLRLERI